MRILIANHVDASLLLQTDQRAFVQRIFWFAQDHDLVVLPAPPDQDFLTYVTNFTGVKASTLRIHVTPAGRFEHKLFDPDTLADQAFLEKVAIDTAGVTEIFSLWPSAQVAEFAAQLGLAHAFPGAAFFAQQGDELSNNKGNFRAFAAAAGVPICNGAVCRTKEHAESTLRALLQDGAAMVKQAHNHAGNGNELVMLSNDQTGHAGSIDVKRLRSLTDVRRYIEKRWEWASANNRYPVVIEQFQPRSRTIYAEFMATDVGVSFGATGSLGYKNGRLIEEIVPLRCVNGDVYARLVQHGSRLAHLYQSFGYRGCLSADALVDESGKLVFTEMNARVGGSLHLYDPIGYKIVDVWQKPERSVVQYPTGRNWKIPSLTTFLDASREMGLAYDKATRKGLIGIMPMAGPAYHGGFLFCVSYEVESEAKDAYQSLEERFA